MIQNLTPRTVIIFLLLVMGCSSNASHTNENELSKKNLALLEQLTSDKEPERFKVLDPAFHRIGGITIQELESCLIALRPKNVSTLIYVYMKTKNDTLYSVNLPSKEALERSNGSFPNIVYYYARVNPTKGLKNLVRLYGQVPDKRMAICKAIGEIPNEDAYDFLLSNAKSEKLNGNNILSHLSGLKRTSQSIILVDLYWLLEQNLDREELIALSEWGPQLTDDQLKALWKEGAKKEKYVVQVVLGNPQKYFETLQWMIDKYLKARQIDIVRQMLLSDGMRRISDNRISIYRDTTLEKLK